MNKQILLQVYVNPEQKNRIKNEATKLGLSVSSYLKLLAFSQKTKGDRTE